MTALIGREQGYASEKHTEADCPVRSMNIYDISVRTAIAEKFQM